MPTKQIDRLMFAQGDACFFCKKPLSPEEASVEHLLASANGGNNHDNNCVTCCKAINSLFGSMSLKEKFQVVLNQKGNFRCPNGKTAKKASSPASLSVSVAQTKMLSTIVANLKQRGNSKPRTLKTLKSTIISILPKETESIDIDTLIQTLTSTGKIIVDDNKISYSL